MGSNTAVKHCFHSYVAAKKREDDFADSQMMLSLIVSIPLDLPVDHLLPYFNDSGTSC